VLGEVGFVVGGAAGPAQRGADLVGGVGQQLLGARDGGVVHNGRGAPDLGDHAEQAGGFMRGLAGLGAQQR